MASKLDTLRMSFDRMNRTQKKSFIAKLQAQSTGKNNPELTKFLNECIQKYNAEVRGNTSINSFNNFNNLPDIKPSIEQTIGQTVEQKYENTIQLYLENGYYIVQQTSDTTIMLSKDFANNARLSAALGGMSAAISTGPAFQNNAVHNAHTAAYSKANLEQHDYEVVIRITKTGELSITGCTLEKLQEKRVREGKIAIIFLIGLGIFAIFLLVLLFIAAT